MAGESLIIGSGNWGVKSSNLLGYNLINSKYVPRELTFARATTGTRTNASGLVEEVPPNLFTYSEQFDNALWGKASTISITPNTTTAPNGTVTADSFILNGAGSCFIFQTPVVSFNFFTASIYVKYVNRQFIQILYGSGLTEYANFDILNGLVTGGSYTGASISNEGNGWFRISLTSTGVVASLDTYIWAIDSGTALRAAACNGIGSYSIWGAQIVNGSSAKPYFGTTTRLNFPRIDYSTGTAALLMEPQRTNISTGSESMASSWLPIGATLTANSTISPSGLLNAAKLTITTGNGYAYRDIPTVASTVYTFSVYIKSATGSDVNGALNAAAGSIAFVANNNWQRFSLTFTASATLTTFYIGGYTSLSLGEDVFIYGAQVEVGPSATSYIPTIGASVSRNADEFLRSGLQAAGLLTPTQNTFFFDISSTVTTGSNFNFITFTATTGLPIAIWKFAGNQNFNIQISGTFIDSGVNSGKFAVVQNGSQTKLFINGVLNTTGAATGTIDAIQSYIALYASASPALVKSLITYPTALSDAECIALTTP